jgi:hypothetical protein
MGVGVGRFGDQRVEEDAIERRPVAVEGFENRQGRGDRT